MRDLLEALATAFASIHPRLRFAFTGAEGTDVDVEVTELDETGALASIVRQTLRLTPLLTDPRASAFLGWHPKVTLVQVLQRTVYYFRAAL